MGLFSCQLYLDTVDQLEPKQLHALGIRNLLLDVDGTLKALGSDKPEERVRPWLDKMRQAGIGLCLLSNGWGKRIRQIADQLQLAWVAPAFKPLPFGCWLALIKLRAKPRETALVGDQLFTDVLAGKLAGVRCILVRPICPESDPWYLRMRRPIEQWILKRTLSPPDRSHGADEKNHSK